jgi:hypothetical protein
MITKEVTTIPICFWCGTKKNEITRIQIPESFTTPHTTLVDYTPCESCIAQMRQGITVVEVNDTPYMNQPPIIEGHYPTGKWAIVKVGFFDPLLDNPEILNTIKQSQKILLRIEDFKKLGLDSDFKNMN